MTWRMLAALPLCLLFVGCAELGGASKGSHHAPPAAPVIDSVDSGAQPQPERKRKPRRVS